MTNKKTNIKKSLEELQKITDWFQNEDIDLDQGLEKLKEGMKLIKDCRGRIQEIENELIEVKKELDDDSDIDVAAFEQDLFGDDLEDLN